MANEQPPITVAQFGGKWVTKETFIAACYARLCVRAEFKAEVNTGLEPDPSGFQKQIISDYKDMIHTDYTKGWYDGNARTFTINLLQHTTGLRTRLHGQNCDTEKVLNSVYYHEEDVDRAAIRRLTTTEEYNATMDSFIKLENSKLSARETAVLKLSYLRSKYGMYTDNARALEILESEFPFEGIVHGKIQHKGKRENYLNEVQGFTDKMCENDRSVCFGVPGITSKAVLFDRLIANEKDEKAAKIVEDFHFCPEGALVPSLWHWRIVASTYILAVLIGCGVIFFKNLTKKDNFIERAMDSLSVLTLLLVSIFGLVKLTSEDPSVLRNTVLGRRLITEPSKIVKYFDNRNKKERTIYQAILASKAQLQWLSSERACYSRIRPSGKMILTGSLTAEDAWTLGLIVNDGLAMDFELQRNYVSSVTADAEYHKGGDSDFVRIYGGCTFYRNNQTGIAGKIVLSR